MIVVQFGRIITRVIILFQATTIEIRHQHDVFLLGI
jgi:hypothetical protein